VNQKISPTYENTYNYQFDHLDLQFDLSTVSVKPIEGGISHQMKGTIKNYNQ
jgi:hypothetical protein